MSEPGDTFAQFGVPPGAQFGVRQTGWTYAPRPSVYAIAHNRQGRLLIARSRGRMILPGGGVDGEETAEQALHREVLEETGWLVEIIGEACRAGQYVVSRRKGRASNKQAIFFLVEAVEQVGPPTENNHQALWVDRQMAIGRLHREFFRWAVERTGPDLC